MKKMIQEIVEHHKIRFLANLWVVVLTLFIGFNLVSAASSWQYVGNAGFSSQEGMFITQAFDSKGTPYVAFEDAGNSRKVTVMKYAYNSTTSKTEWHNVGSAGFSNGRVAYTTIAFDSSDTPYITFADVADDYKATVMKYDSSKSQWVTVGSKAFTPYQADVLTLVFDNNDVPYVAYSDNCTSGSYNPPSSPCSFAKASVMKYAYNSATSKTEWHNVGSAKFSAGWANFINLAFDKNNTPYVAFQDSDNSNLATVMKYAYNSATSKTEWHNVGSAGFSNGTAHNMTFAIDSNNVPYVAYWYGGSSKTIDVMRYDASSSKWASVGSSSLPSGEMVYSSSTIVFDSSNTPYILINDNAKSLKVSVFKYDTSASKWAPVGAQGFTNNAPLSSFLSINSANVLHVAFLDLVSGKYKVSVVKFEETLSSEKDITEFKIGTDKGDIDQPKHTILVKVGCATDVTKLAPDITISKGATISPKSGAVQDFTNPVTYVVTAEDGSKQSYVVTVYKLSCEKEITEFTGGNSKGKIDQTNHTIDLDVKCNIDITKLAPDITISKYATIDPASGIARDFSLPKKYIVTAEDQSTQEYLVTVRKLPCEKELITLNILGKWGAVDQTKHTVKVMLPYGTNVTSLTPTITISKDATISPASGASNNFTTPQRYTVTALDSTTQDYLVSVEVNQWQVVGKSTFTPDDARYISIDTDKNGIPYVAFTEDTGTTYDDLSVMKYNSSGWVNVGAQGFTPGEASEANMALQPNSGIPYVAYRDGTKNLKLSVMYYDTGRSQWYNVGYPGFSTGPAKWINMAFDSSGKPYVAFAEMDAGLTNYKVSVMRYESSLGKWVYVAGARFGGTSSEVYYVDIAFDRNNIPYVSYVDAATNKPTVKKSNGKAWVDVGNTNFTSGNVETVSLAMSGNVPYVAFTDASAGKKASLMKLNLATAKWDYVGSAGFSATEAYDTSLKIASGIPYVAYESEWASGAQTTVMKYVGSSWVNVGNANFSDGETVNTSLTIDPFGVPYVVYQDMYNDYGATVMRFPWFVL